jgi:3-(3-hydroxy-phenyl)propionate hydroxylase
MKDVPFELEWASVYTFSCQRMARFRHGQVLFAGDAAHGVSPFGARGANSGVQDADNLGWKLRLVLQGRAPETLLDTYAAEREAAADENILASTRSTDFITPKTPVSRMFRDAVLELAREHKFARPLVNSGRLSTPTTYAGSPLNTPDEDAWAGGPPPGAVAPEAPPPDRSEFSLLDWRIEGTPLLGGAPAHFILRQDDATQMRRYDARPGTAYLLRPDGHVAARWRRPTAEKVEAAIRRACAC